MPVQLRNEDGATWEVADVKTAFETADTDVSIWKISWSEGDHRIRLVRFILECSPSGHKNAWRYEPLAFEVDPQSLPDTIEDGSDYDFLTGNPEEDKAKVYPYG